MTQYCNLKPSATINIKKEHPENIFTTNCPINIQEFVVPKQGVTIVVTGEYELGSKHVPGSISEIDPNGTNQDSYSLNLVTCSTAIGCGANSPNGQGEPYYQAQILRNGSYTGLHFGTAGWYLVQISDVIYGGDKYRLQITDKDNNQIYQQNFDNKPEYTVACGDECPVGQERIPTIKYPGYKCRDRCPPETCCECDCGDVICCYGSDGRVIKTIPK